MIFQLINQDVRWFQYLINISITVVGRLLDLLSTRYVSKELRLETNRLARRIGWKGMILLQVPIIILGALDIYFSFFLLWWSIFLFASNIEGSWYIKETGEETYYKELQKKVKRSTFKKIFFSEIAHIFKYTFAGISIIIFLFVYQDLLMVFLIALALVILGIHGTISSLTYLLKLRKKNQVDENGKT